MFNPTTPGTLFASRRQRAENRPKPDRGPEWQILKAWRWLVRDTDSENIFDSTFATDRKKASALEGPADLAYRGVMPAALGRAIQNVDIEKEDKDPDLEWFATIYDPAQTTQDADRRSTLWRLQQPAIMVFTTLVLGLRWLRAELRRRVKAWKAVATASYHVPSPPINPTATPPIHPTPIAPPGTAQK